MLKRKSLQGQKNTQKTNKAYILLTQEIFAEDQIFKYLNLNLNIYLNI